MAAVALAKSQSRGTRAGTPTQLKSTENRYKKKGGAVLLAPVANSNKPPFFAPPRPRHLPHNTHHPTIPFPPISFHPIALTVAIPPRLLPRKGNSPPNTRTDLPVGRASIARESSHDRPTGQGTRRNITSAVKSGTGISAAAPLPSPEAIFAP